MKASQQEAQEPLRQLSPSWSYPPPPPPPPFLLCLHLHLHPLALAQCSPGQASGMALSLSGVSDEHRPGHAPTHPHPVTHAQSEGPVPGSPERECQRQSLGAQAYRSNQPRPGMGSSSPVPAAWSSTRGRLSALLLWKQSWDNRPPGSHGPHFLQHPSAREAACAQGGCVGTAQPQEAQFAL